MYIVVMPKSKDLIIKVVLICGGLHKQQQVRFVSRLRSRGIFVSHSNIFQLG